jgi:hypothetical protein
MIFNNTSKIHQSLIFQFFSNNSKFQNKKGGNNLDFVVPFPNTDDPVKSFSIDLGYFEIN